MTTLPSCALSVVILLCTLSIACAQSRGVQLADGATQTLLPCPALLVLDRSQTGELLGVQWRDVNFDLREIAIRRSITVGEVTTPKSGRARKIQMTETLATELFDLLGRRRRETLARGWSDIPSWVFCSTVGSHIEERNFSRV